MRALRVRLPACGACIPSRIRPIAEAMAPYSGQAYRAGADPGRRRARRSGGRYGTRGSCRTTRERIGLFLEAERSAAEVSGASRRPRQRGSFFAGRRGTRALIRGSRPRSMSSARQRREGPSGRNTSGEKFAQPQAPALPRHAKTSNAPCKHPARARRARRIRAGGRRTAARREADKRHGATCARAWCANAAAQQRSTRQVLLSRL